MKKLHTFLAVCSKNSKHYLTVITDFVIVFQPLTGRVKLLKSVCWCECLCIVNLISVNIQTTHSHICIYCAFVLAGSLWISLHQERK